MNIIRILINAALTVLCAWGGIHLLGQESFFLRDRWHPETGTYFSGVSLYLLAFGLFCFGAFTAAVAQAWVRGIIPMPDQGKIQPHPAYKGQILVRYWYFVIPALGMVLGSFMLAEHVPNPSFIRY